MQRKPLVATLLVGVAIGAVVAGALAPAAFASTAAGAEPVNRGWEAGLKNRGWDHSETAVHSQDD